MIKKFIAIKKNGRYYIRDSSKYPNAIPDSDRMRFDANRRESFDDKWAVFDTLPTHIEQCIGGGKKLVEYRLKDGFQITESTPETMPINTFVYDDDDECTNSDIAGLYEGVFEDSPCMWEPIDIPIELIDTDCEPIGKIKYSYHSTFPHYVEHHPAVHHNYPCHINGKDAFSYIVKAIKDNLPDNYNITSDFGFRFAVDIDIPLLHDETQTIDVSSIGARKPKWKKVPLRSISKTVIDICTPKYSYGVVINDVNADNYYELEKKMDDIIHSYIDLMQQIPIMCPHCKGYGWTIEGDK